LERLLLSFLLADQRKPMDEEEVLKRGSNRQFGSPRVAEVSLCDAGYGVISGLASTIALLIVCWWLLSGCAPTWGSGMVIVDRSFHGREIDVASGSLFRVELEQGGATGYTWEVRGLDPDYLEIVEEETVGRPGPGDLVGVPVMRRWTLLAKKTGKTEARFVYFRPWEGEESAVDRFTLKVNIH
jgi:predicted secreted protein